MSTSVLIANEFQFFFQTNKNFLKFATTPDLTLPKAPATQIFQQILTRFLKENSTRTPKRILRKNKKIPNDFVWDILSFQLAIFSASLSLTPTLWNWPHGTDLQPLVKSFCIWPSGGGRIGVSWSGEEPQQMKIFFSTSPNPLPAVLARRPKSLFDRICLFYPKKYYCCSHI